MKKTIKLAVVAALALGSTSAFATNGDVMIGQGAKSRSMGGVGIAKSFGAESGLANPALISTVKDMEVTGAVTFFMPNVAFGSNAGDNINQAFGANGYQGTSTPPVAGSAFATGNPADVVAGPSAAITSSDSLANFSIIPEIAFASRISDSVVWGVSMTGTAGMGTDYTGKTNGSFSMYTSLALLKVATPLAIDITSGLTLGVTPILQYGSLQMAHDTFNPAAPQKSPLADDTSFGYEVGLAYDVDGVDGLTLGAVYKSKIDMEYENVISASTTIFGVNDAITSGDHLAQPAEIGLGISYTTDGNTIALDYKQIAWGDAAGYSDFGWEDQTVIAVGYEYAENNWAFRIGYNHGTNPITEQNGAKGTTQPGENYVGAVKNFFNLSGFPGVVESHMTVGGGINLSDSLSLDAAFIYAPEVTLSYDTSGLTEGAAYQLAGGATPYTGTPTDMLAGAIAGQTAASSADVTHSQMGVNIAMTYKF
ncbi:aromatic hydrocarbon degradation protein [Sulfurimonas aquatica]|uniref:Aromatic hydrocarbon degradation protein n=1 Tax=Sulfurimonas aquatica TaxID=2672570 RepID=A0A975B2E2_9BACT|nr:outer membrane protein transport protein [Sulfurimonas aquatica]QSZ42986.1 aromatic hydrocarbon degradation protein [Sulfurimonas aquatica]